MAFSQVRNGSAEETLGFHSSPGAKCPEKFISEHVTSTWGDLAPSPRGMENSGTNTCYLNSVLQILSFTPEVFKYLSTSKHTDTCNKADFCLVCELEKHITLLTTGNSATTTNTICPQSFIDNIGEICDKFHVPQQQDALECLTSIIDKLKHQEQSLGQKFYFNMCNILTCKSCGVVKNNLDSNNFMLLNPDPLGKSSIERAMCNITKSEIISDYMCESCDKKVDVEKSCTIHQPPEVLVCQINRFNPCLDRKNTNFVSYPEKLDISPFLTSSNSQVDYNLHGVIVHNGAYSTSGHYLAFIKSPSGKWFRVNDTKVSEVSEKTVLKQPGAYICIYQKDQINRQSADNVTSNVTNVCFDSKCDSVKQSVETISDTPVLNCNKRKLDSDNLPSAKKCKIENVKDTKRKILKRPVSDINNNVIDRSQKKRKFQEVHESGSEADFSVRFTPLSSGKAGYYVYTCGLKMIIACK